MTAPRLVVVDYGMGNLRSVATACARAGASVTVTSDPEVVATAPALVLPGVGAFGQCMANLTTRGLVGPITAAVRRGVPFLGICLGYQLLFDESEEFGPVKGLGLLPGRVVAFPPMVDGRRLKVPHMGWNRVRVTQRHGLFAGIEDGAYLYFVHSYVVAPRDAYIVASETTYGVPFASSVQVDRLVACQFHPEKSQALGLRLLTNFLALTR